MTMRFSPALALALATSACSLVIGDLSRECSVDADCASRDTAAACIEGLCVIPADPYYGRCERTIGATDAESPIVFGAVMPVTKTDGTPDGRAGRVEAMALAVQEINQRGIVGKKLQLRVCDTRGSATDAEKLARRLVEDHDAVGLLAGGSADVLAVSSVATSAQVLLMGISSTSPEISDLTDGGLVWRTAGSDARQGEVLRANLLPTTTRVTIISVGDPYGDGLRSAFVGALSAEMKDKVRMFRFAPDVSTTTDEGKAALDGILDDANDTVPDAILIIAQVTHLPHLLVGVRNRPALKAAQLYLTDSARNATLLTGETGAALENAIGTGPKSPSGDSFELFRQNFLQETRIDPRDLSYTAHSYDAVYLLSLASAWALGRAPGSAPTGQGLAEGLAKISDKGPASSSFSMASQFVAATGKLAAGEAIDVTGTSGDLDFDEKGDPAAEVEVWRVKDGAFATLR